jgi:hypothetical protein
MVKPITLFEGSMGLNTVLDPERLSTGTRDLPNHVEFAEAVNVSIDDRGLVSLRNGNELKRSGSYHSLFCDGGDCFVVEDRTNDAAIHRVNADYTLTGVRSGLTKGARMSFGQSVDDTFYSNGFQLGYIRSAVSNAWAVGAYNGPDVDMQFESTIPIGNHISFPRGGSCMIAEGSSLWLNHAPYQYGLFNKRSGYIGFRSPITMLCPVETGFFASDSSQTWFFQRTGWNLYKQNLVEDAPAIEWSLAHDKIQLKDIGFESDGFGRIWASALGICLGMDDGSFVNLTKSRVKYPTGYNAGSCLIKGTVIINTLY